MITVADIVKNATQDKPINIKQIHNFARRKYPEIKITSKDIRGYLFNEYYDEDYEKCVRINESRNGFFY